MNMNYVVHARTRPRGTSRSVLSLFIGNVKIYGSLVGICIIHRFRDI